MRGGTLLGVILFLEHRCISRCMSTHGWLFHSLYSWTGVLIWYDDISRDVYFSLTDSWYSGCDHPVHVRSQVHLQSILMLSHIAPRWCEIECCGMYSTRARPDSLGCLTFSCIFVPSSCVVPQVTILEWSTMSYIIKCCQFSGTFYTFPVTK